MKTTLDTLLKQITPLPYNLRCKLERVDLSETGDEYESSISPEMASYLTHAANVLPVLVEALEANLKCLTMDSDSEEDYAPEIEQTRQALTTAKEIDL